MNFDENFLYYTLHFTKNLSSYEIKLQMIEKYLELNSKSNIGNAKLYLIMKYSMDQLLIN